MTASPPSTVPRRPRLAYVFSRYPVLSQTFVDNEILALEAAGWDVVVCALNPSTQELRHARLDTLKGPVIHAPPTSGRRALETQYRQAGKWPEALIADYAQRFGGGEEADRRCRNAVYFAEMLKHLGVDHLHIHFANQATYSALFLRELAGLSFSFTPQAQDFLVDLRCVELLQEMADKAAFIVAPCDAAMQALVERCPASREKIIRIYNGIDPVGYATQRPQPQQGQLRVVTVGRLIEFKGFHHLISAVGATRQYGVDVQLDILGDGPWRETLEQQVKELALSDQVRLRGSVQLQEMKASFAQSDLFALACIVDPKGASDMLPTVITEAMLSAMPVLSSKVAGVPEQVEHGATGLLTEPGDETALAQALVHLAQHPDEIIRLGQAGRQRAEALFSVQATLPQLERLFHQQAAEGTRAAFETVILVDLDDAASRKLFINDQITYAASGVVPWLLAEEVSEKSLLPLNSLGQALWMPEATILKMESAHWPHLQAKLDQAVTRLQPSYDLKDIAWARPRALWIASQWPRLSSPKRLLGASRREQLVAALVAEVTGAVALDCSATKPPLWLRWLPKSWRQRRRVGQLAAMARS